MVRSQSRSPPCRRRGRGCGSSDSGSSSSTDTRRPRPRTTLGTARASSTWSPGPGYAEDGSTDPKVDWVTPFEKETGCQVNVKIGNTSDEMVTLMRTGQYDVVSASGDADAAADRRRRRRAGQHRRWSRTTPTSSGAQGPAVEHASTACTTASPRPRRQHPDVAHRQGHAGADSWERRLRQRTRPTRARSRPTTPRSTSPTRRCTSRPRSPTSGSTTPTSSTRSSSTPRSTCSSSSARTSASTGRTTRRQQAAFTSRRHGRRHDLAGHRQPARGRQGPGHATLPNEGATGWSDTWMIVVEGQEPQLHVQVDGLHRLAEGQRPGGRVVRRGAGQPEVVRADRGQGRTARPSTPTTRPTRSRSPTGRRRTKDCGDDRGEICKDYSEWVAGLDGDQGLAPGAPAPGTQVAASPRNPGMPAGRHGPPASSGATRACGCRCCSRRRSAGWRSPTSARWRCCSSPRSGTLDTFSGEIVKGFSLDNFKTLVETTVYRTITLRTVAHRRRGDGDRRAAGLPDRLLHGQGRAAGARAALLVIAVAAAAVGAATWSRSTPGGSSWPRTGS